MATAETLAAAIPDLKRYGSNVEVRAELSLVEPITVDDARAAAVRSDEDAPMLQFHFPRIAIAYAIKSDSSHSTWMPFAEFEFHVSQNARAKLNSNVDPRIMQIDWLGDALVTANGRFVSSYQPTDHRINMQQIEQLFERGWWNLTQNGPISQATVSDVDFGFAKLRASDIDWTSPYLSATFMPAGDKVTNLSKNGTSTEALWVTSWARR
jgi:hypothetical protein